MITLEPPVSSKTQAALDRRVSRSAFGILVRKERWGLSLRGKMALMLALCLAGVAAIRSVYPFLAITQPVPSETLVVEGWIPAYAVQQLANQYAARNYQQILVARGLFKGRNAHESGESAANYIAESLVELGVPRERVHVVLVDSATRDRTYHSAVAVKNWSRERGKEIDFVEVVTMGPHARRSRLLFQKAFGSRARVGVLALEDQEYDPRHWWRSSAGFREVLAESIAYIYARFFFHPSN